MWDLKAYRLKDFILRQSYTTDNRYQILWITLKFELQKQFTTF